MVSQNQSLTPQCEHEDNEDLFQGSLCARCLGPLALAPLFGRPLADIPGQMIETEAAGAGRGEERLFVGARSMCPGRFGHCTDAEWCGLSLSATRRSSGTVSFLPRPTKPQSQATIGDAVTTVVGSDGQTIICVGPMIILKQWCSIWLGASKWEIHTHANQNAFV